MHLCIHDYDWWAQKLLDRGCVIHASKDTMSHCIFYVTTHRTFDMNLIEGRVNVPEEDLLKNIEQNSKLGLPQIRPYPVQDTEIMLLAGGPSLNEFEEEIIQNRKDGMKLVTVNNTYHWAMERGLKPSLQFLIDARGFNKRFTEQSELTDETKFIIASSADPESIELLPKDRTFLFHTTLSDEILESIVENYGELYKHAFPVPGGCTVTLRAIAALRLLGFFKIHVYGFDSCLSDDGYHHAYSQPENDSDRDNAVPIIVAGGSKYERKFMCAPWMAMQAHDFRKMATDLLGDVHLDIKGDGMIAYMVKVAAELNENIDIEIEDELPPTRLYVDKEFINKCAKDRAETKEN